MPPTPVSRVRTTRSTSLLFLFLLLGEFLLLLSTDLLPLGLLFLQPLQLLLLLGALLPPLVDVLPQLLVQLTLLRLLARFQEVSIAFGHCRPHGFTLIRIRLNFLLILLLLLLLFLVLFLDFLVLVELLVRHDGGGGVVGGAELF